MVADGTQYYTKMLWWRGDDRVVPGSWYYVHFKSRIRYMSMPTVGAFYGLLSPDNCIRAGRRRAASSSRHEILQCACAGGDAWSANWTPDYKQTYNLYRWLKICTRCDNLTNAWSAAAPTELIGSNRRSVMIASYTHINDAFNSHLRYCSLQLKC